MEPRDSDAEAFPPPGVIAPAGSDTAEPRNLAKRIALVERCMGPLAGRRILDAGCGGGDYVGALLARGADAHGIEFGDGKLVAAKQQPDAVSARITPGDIEGTVFDTESFDAVLLNEVLEHVPDDAAALREIHRILRPGGSLLLLSPNRRHPFETHGVFALGSGRRISHTTPFIPWIPLPLGRRFFRYWARNYWPGELRELVVASGFEVEECGYLWPTFENISGRQPGWMRPVRPLLRALSFACEHTPVLRSLGASQWILARRSRPPSGSLSR